MKKYILTEETRSYCGITLHRIKAVKDFGNVKAGDLGGWIEKEENLSHEGNAWVGDNAWVDGNAWIRGNARVGDNAWVDGNALVSGNTDIMWVSKIGSRFGTTTICKDKNGGIQVSCGCFLGSLDEFENKVKETHGDNKYGKEYAALIELVKIHFEMEVDE